MPALFHLITGLVICLENSGQRQCPVQVRPPAKDFSGDEFMADFKQLYYRLPGNFRGSPPDQGVEIVKTRMLLATLKDLISDLKAKL